MTCPQFVGWGDGVRFLPEEIDYVDCFRFLIDPEESAQPALLSDCGMLDPQFHSIATPADAQVGNMRIETQAPR